MNIRLENIVKKYKKRCVLNNINICFFPKKILLIRGESGVGKSTLINIITGLGKPDEGKIFYDDVEISGFDDNTMATYRREKFGIMSQKESLIPYFSLMENIQFIYNVKDKKDIEKNSIETSYMLEKMNLTKLKDEMPYNLSAGEIKRAKFICSIIGDPEVIVMDEPTANLDKDNRIKMLECLREKADEGRTVIVSSHEEETLNYCDYVLDIK